MDFGTIFGAAKENLPLAMLVAAGFVIVAMYREGRQREREHLATAMQVAPLAAKLVDGVAAVERMADRFLTRRDGGGT